MDERKAIYDSAAIIEADEKLLREAMYKLDFYCERSCSSLGRERAEPQFHDQGHECQTCKEYNKLCETMEIMAKIKERLYG